MKHLILTRLALGEPSEEWLRYRIGIFEKYCAPSLKIQSCKDFVWILAISINTPKWFVDRVRKAYPSAKILYSNSKGIAIDWTNCIPKELISSVLLTTRLDNDDMLHKEFVHEVQSIAKKQKSTCALDAPLGYNLDQHSLACYYQYAESNHFLSLIEFGTCQTIYCKQHNSIGEKFRIIKYCQNKPLWVEGVNDKNLINNLRTKNEKVVWENVKRNFLPDMPNGNFKVSPNPNLKPAVNFANNGLIFIQIATYRDSELIPTIKDILKKARYPERLTFGICRQYCPADGFDNLDIYKNDNRFRVFNVHYLKASGVGWARNITQRLYGGEEYTLQIDSHMRFIQSWDVQLVDMIQFLCKQGYKKPLLTGYMGGYTPDKALSINYSEPPLQMVVNSFDESGIPSFTSKVIPFFDQLVCPVPAKFLSAGFYFTLGQFCKEIPYDPDIYFLGEEISMAARAYTNGYDMFHPHKMVLWHHYNRKNSPKQWDDDKVWHLKNTVSYSKLKKLLKIGNENKDYNLGQFGLGKLRSLKEYERYSGLSFSEKRIRNY